VNFPRFAAASLLHDSRYQKWPSGIRQIMNGMGLAELVRKKQVSRSECWTGEIARTEKVDPQINAVVVSITTCTTAIDQGFRRVLHRRAVLLRIWIF